MPSILFQSFIYTLIFFSSWVFGGNETQKLFSGAESAASMEGDDTSFMVADGDGADSSVSIEGADSAGGSSSLSSPTRTDFNALARGEGSETGTPQSPNQGPAAAVCDDDDISQGSIDFMQDVLAQAFLAHSMMLKGEDEGLFMELEGLIRDVYMQILLGIENGLITARQIDLTGWASVISVYNAIRAEQLRQEHLRQEQKKNKREQEARRLGLADETVSRTELLLSGTKPEEVQQMLFKQQAEIERQRKQQKVAAASAAPVRAGAATPAPFAVAAAASASPGQEQVLPMPAAFLREEGSDDNDDQEPKRGEAAVGGPVASNMTFFHCTPSNSSGSASSNL
jgi:hypothetical protein